MHFPTLLLQLCVLLDDDNRHRQELEAQQFATYIQKQEEEGPHEEMSTEDLSKKLFPQGDFANELAWDDYSMSIEASKGTNKNEEANEFGLLSGEKKLNEMDVQRKAMGSNQQWNFKSHQIQRFKELISSLYQTIESKGTQGNEFHQQKGQRWPFASTVDLSVEGVHDRSLLIVGTICNQECMTHHNVFCAEIIRVFTSTKWATFTSRIGQGG